MKAIYLRFPDQAAADAALTDVQTLARDDVGELIADEVPLPGWHVNLIVSDELPLPLQEFQVTPASPLRRFAGF